MGCEDGVGDRLCGVGGTKAGGVSWVVQVDRRGACSGLEDDSIGMRLVRVATGGFVVAERGRRASLVLLEKWRCERCSSTEYVDTTVHILCGGATLHSHRVGGKSSRPSFCSPGSPGPVVHLPRFLRYLSTLLT